MRVTTRSGGRPAMASAGWGRPTRLGRMLGAVLVLHGCSGLLAGPEVLLAGPEVLLAHSLVKIRPEARLPTEAAVRSISAARGEYESLQLAVAGPAVVTGLEVAFPGAAEGPAAVLVHRQHYINITVVSNCDGAQGRWPDALVPAVDVYDRQARSAFPVRVQAGSNQAFWVDVYVANDTVAGTHAGTATVHLDGTEPLVLPLSLRVRNFTLPAISRYATSYNCGIQNIIDGRFLGKPPSNITAEERVHWQRQYVDLGLMHRVTFSDFLNSDSAALGTTPEPDWATVESHWARYLGTEEQAVDLPFGLQRTRPTTIQLPAQHYPGPPVNVSVNASLVDRLWHRTGCLNPTPRWGYSYWSGLPDYGVRDMMVYCSHSEQGLDDPWSRTCAPVGAKVSCAPQPDPHVPLGPANNTLAVRYWQNVAAHAKSSGWWPRVFDYTCDEPGADVTRYHACRARAEAIHSADSGFRVMITAEKPSADSVNISDMIDIWTPIINFMDSNASLCQYNHWYDGNRRGDYAPLVKEGKGLWWYQSCMSEGCASAVQPAHGSSAPGCNPDEKCTQGTWPSYMIDTKATFNRVMSWMSFKYDIRGELYWGTNAADSHYTDPRNSSWETQWYAGGNGDGSLTYPGRPDHIGGTSTIPIASMRLKHIRDGLEDLEYLYLLQDATGSRAAAEEVVGEVVQHAYQFEHDPAVMLAARAKLADAVERAMCGSACV